jgi:ATP-dependent protease ClpP protease subunit
MALSFKETRQLTKLVNSKIDEINAGGLSFKEKRAATKALNDAVEKLTAKGLDTSSSPTLEKLLAGEYDKLPPIRFLAMLEKAVKEVDGDIEPIKQPVIRFIDKNRPKVDQVMESALMDTVEQFENAPGRPGVPMGPGMGMGFMQTGSPVRYQCVDPGNPQGPKNIMIDIDQTFTEPHTFREIIRALENAQEGDTATLKVNSPGGRTDSAQAVYVALLETKARTKAKIINAASSGSIVSMACDEIQTTPFCTMMIHNASAGTQGKVGDMAAASSHYREHFKAWFNQLYDNFLSPDEITDVSKGQEFYLKESDIKSRLDGWVPIRNRHDDVAMEA